MKPNEIALSLRGAATKWEATHPIIGVGQLRVHDALNDAADCIEKLQAELESSQRRERAAVEDLKRHRKYKCDACRFSGGVTAYSPCRDCQSPISNFGDGWEWRDPEQEGE